MNDHVAMLTAKVGILERLVRGLLIERFKQTPNPMAAAEQFMARFKETTARNMSQDPDDAALMLVQVNTDLILDQLLADLRRSLGKT